MTDIQEGDSCAEVKEDAGSALKMKFAAKKSQQTAIKKALVKTLLKDTRLYSREGLVLLRSGRDGYLDISRTDSEIKATAFEDYVLQRIRNFGLPYVYSH